MLVHFWGVASPGSPEASNAPGAFNAILCLMLNIQGYIFKTKQASFNLLKCTELWQKITLTLFNVTADILQRCFFHCDKMVTPYHFEVGHFN